MCTSCKTRRRQINLIRWILRKVNRLPGICALPAASQPSGSRWPSGAGRWGRAARRPPPRPWCPTDATGEDENWNIIIHFFTLHFMRAIRHVCPERWLATPPRHAAWEMESFHVSGLTQKLRGRISPIYYTGITWVSQDVVKVCGRSMSMFFKKKN